MAAGLPVILILWPGVCRLGYLTLADLVTSLSTFAERCPSPGHLPGRPRATGDRRPPAWL